MDIKDAKIKVLTALVKYYRSQLKEKSIAMDEKRVRKILRCPSASLVNALLDEANLTVSELEIINQCVRMGYTQEKVAELLDHSRNYVQKQYSDGMKKLVSAWSALGWM